LDRGTETAIVQLVRLTLKSDVYRPDLPFYEPLLGG
jgi:hypothetical protein